MPVPDSSVVEFLGGPMDGHFDVFTAPLKPFVVFQSGIHRSTGIVAGLVRLLSRQRRNCDSLWAVYELQDDAAYQRYRHVRTLQSPGFESLELLTYVNAEDRKRHPVASSVIR